MQVITYSASLQITNLDQLSRGTGAKFLEAMEPHDASLPLIAVAWRRVKPKTLPSGHVLIAMPTK